MQYCFEPVKAQTPAEGLLCRFSRQKQDSQFLLCVRGCLRRGRTQSTTISVPSSVEEEKAEDSGNTCVFSTAIRGWREARRPGNLWVCSCL